MLRDQVRTGQNARRVSRHRRDAASVHVKKMAKNQAAKQKGRTPCGALPFVALKSGNECRFFMRLTTSLLRSCRSGFSLRCLLVRRLLVCLLVRRLVSSRSSSSRSSRSSFRSRSLCECSRCEEASDQSSDQFVHCVNPQLELINQVTRVWDQVGKRAIHLSVDSHGRRIQRNSENASASGRDLVATTGVRNATT